MINILFILLVLIVVYWAASVTMNNTKEWGSKDGWFTKKYWFHFYLMGIPTILACFYIFDLVFLAKTIDGEFTMNFTREDYGALTLIALSILWVWKRFTVNYQKNNF